MSTTPKTFSWVLNVLTVIFFVNVSSLHGQPNCECSNAFIDLHGDFEILPGSDLEVGFAIIDDHSKARTEKNISVSDPMGNELFSTKVILNDAGDFYGTAEFSPSQPGTYSLIYECEENCLTRRSFLVCGNPVESVSVLQPSCAGLNDAEISISTNVDAQCTFNWSNGESGSSVENLSPGYYSVMITDRFGCVHRHQYQIVDPEPLKAEIKIGYYDCNGIVDSIVVAEVTGGHPPYNIDWAYDGMGDMDDENELHNKPTGMIDLEVMDSRGCRRYYTVDIEYNQGMALNPKWIQLDPLISNGSGEFIYDLRSTTNMSMGDIDNDGYDGSVFDVTFHPDLQSAENKSDMLPSSVASDSRDTIYCRVEGIDGCFAISNVELMINNYCLFVSEACSNDPPVLLQPVECSVDMPALPSGGVYEIYLIEGLNKTLVNGMITCDNMTGECYLDPTDAEGNYEVRYTYEVNGTLTTRVALFDIQDLNPQILAVQDSICGNEVSVAIRVNPAGGTLLGPSITGQLMVGSNQFFFMDPRQLVVNHWYRYEYTYTQNNASGLVCTKTTIDSFYIVDYPYVEIEAGQTSFCRTSSLTLSAINISANTSRIEWYDPDGVLIGTDPNLVHPNVQKDGLYEVRVYNTQGCMHSAYISINILNLPDLDCETDVRVSCPQGSDGEATVFINNVADLTGYTFEWSNGGTGQTQIGLSAGDYTVTVTNPNGCSDSCVVNVTQPPVFQIECDHVLQQVQCYGTTTGVDSLHVTGGTPPYRYSKDGINFQMSPVLTGLSGGPQTVYVLDANDCLDSCSFSMPEPTELGCAPGAQGSVSCFGGTDGMAEVNPLGGVPPYDITWENGQKTNTITGLSAGTYRVSIEDGNGCICIDSAVISEPTELELTCTIDSLDCFGLSNGSLAVNISGGTPPYQTLWNTGATTNTISGLSAGTYWADIMDANGCMTSCTTVVYEPPALMVDCSGDLLDCFGDSDGVVTANVSGGTPPYTYQWSTGHTTAQVSGLPAGNYQLIVTDARGCVNDSCEVSVAEPLPLNIDLTKDTVCLDFNQTLEALVSGGQPPYNLTWSVSNPGQTGAAKGNLLTPNDPILQFSSLNLDAGIVTLNLLVEDASMCTMQAQTTLLIENCFDLAIRKTVEQTTDYQPGDVVRFDLEIFNQGTVNAYDLVIQDSTEAYLDFLPDHNTSKNTGNPYDWTIDGDNYNTMLAHVPAGESRNIVFYGRINDAFEGFELTNYSEIIFYANAVRDLPKDEDDVEPDIEATEYDNDIDDDHNGFVDNPVDEDRKDFAKVYLCDMKDMACNDLVQVTVDQFGRFIVTPDVLLEGHDNLAMISVTLRDGQGQILSDTLTCAQIGDTITYRVDNGCINTSCWGKIVVEDKMPPVVRCAAPDTVYCFMSGDQYTLDTVTDNCTFTIRRILEDRMESYPCDSAFSGLRTIVSVYEDEYGNVSDTCVKEIYFKRFKIDEVDFPSDTIFNCTNFRDASPDITGVPEVDGYPVFPNDKNCSIAFNYKDDTIQVCGATIKIIRTWTAFDWCADRGPKNPYRQNQLIKVLDEDGPIIYCPGTDLVVDTVATRPQHCLATFELPEPHILIPGQPIVDSSAIYILSECSGFTYSVAHLPAESPLDCTPGNVQPSQANVRLLPNGRWEAFDVPQGCNWFYYTITDDCGNSTVCSFDIYVEDQTPPVAVCDAHTVVSLGISGLAELRAQSVNDGSLDNCSIDTMLIRRMNGAPCGGTNGLKAKELFCCDDLGKTIMVEFSVWDEAGNSNQCMVEVQVQNKIPPVLISCPGDVTIDCQQDYRDTSITGGSPAFEAVCDLEVTFNDVAYLDACGLGFVERTWTAVDATGQTQTTCSQVITVIDNNPLTEKNIDWPAAYIELDGMSNCSVHPDTSLSGRPTVTNNGCADIAMTFEDLRLTKDANSCFKILRTWTVLDWCTYNVNTGQGKFEFEQTIVVKNNTPPDVICSDTTICDLTDGCGADVLIQGKASDDCTDTDDLIWRIEVDIDNDGNIEMARPSQSFVEYLPYGQHKVTYTVRDGCSNEATCSEIISVRDCKAPTPICKNGITTVIMPTTGEIEVWASDFNDKSEDNCTEPDDLDISFSDDVNETVRTFNCDDISTGSSDTIMVDIWVTDEAGNQDFCETILILQDNNGICDPDSMSSLHGNIMSMDQQPLEGVRVMMHNPSQPTTTERMTDVQGEVILSDVPVPSFIEIEPHKNDDVLYGLSTRDIVFLQQYLLGKRQLKGNHLFIAADADNNQRISVSDIVALRKLLLGASTVFPNNQRSWRFMTAEHDLEGAADVYDFPETRAIDVLNTHVQPFGFYGVKIGDVDNSLGIDEDLTTRSFDTWTMNVEKTDDGYLLKAGRDFRLQGLQLSLESGVIDIKPEAIPITPGDWAVHSDHVRLSWSAQEAIEIEEGDVLFVIRSHDDIKLDDDAPLVNEWYGPEEEYGHVNLEDTPALHDQPRIALHQNIPNPFSLGTTIPFEVFFPGEIELSIYNGSGEIIHMVSGYYNKGRHEVWIEGQDLGQKGMLYYRLVCRDQMEIRKMIRM